MAKKYTKNLSRVIRHSIFLKEGWKEPLIQKLSELTEPQAGELTAVLLSEEEVIQAIAIHAVQKAIKNNDTAFLEGLSDLIRSAESTLSKLEEIAERTDEEHETDTFFDPLT
jgi:hypothetical protein